MEHVVALSHSLSVLALQVILQTTAVIGAGLLISLAFRDRNPLLQNLLCRWTLAALLLAPAGVLVVRHTPAPRFSFTLPLDTTTISHEQSTPGTTSPQAYPSLSPGSGQPVEAYIADGVETNTANAIESASEVSSVIKDGTDSEHHHSPILVSESRRNPFVEYAWVAYLTISLVWALLTVIRAFRLLLASKKLRFIIRTAIPAEPEFQLMVERYARRLHAEPPGILRSPFAHSPFLAGIRKPVIIIPDYFTITDDVILHELMHLKRHDIIWSFTGHLVAILFPIQPLVHILLSMMEDTNDLICDRCVVEQLQNPKKYAKRLVNLAALLCPGYTKDSLGLGLLPSQKSLKYRIISILDSNPGKMSLRLKNLLLAGGMTVIICSVLTGYVEVRGEVLNDLLARRFVFVNTLEYVPAAKHLIRAAQTVLNAASGLDTEPRDFQENSPLASNDTIAENGAPNAAESMPHVEFDRGQTSGLPLIRAKAEPVERLIAGLTEDVVAAAPVADDLEISLASSQEYVAGYDVLARMGSLNTDGVRGFGYPAAGDVGIPGTPQIIAEFNAAKPVNVTCDYDFNPLSGASSREEIEEYLYFMSLDKHKQEVAWSPNGVLLAFTDNDRIWVVSIEGGDPVLVYEYKQNGYFIGAISDLGFTPDGSEIVFTKNIYDSTRGSIITITEYGDVAATVSFSNSIPNIESVNLETGEHRVVIEEAYRGTLSRDGRCMFYMRFDPAVYTTVPDEFHMLPMVLDFESGRSMLLTTKRQHYGRPTFSPDDTHLILQCYEYGQPQQLHRLNLSGGEPSPVTSYEPWLPYGRNLRSPAYDPTGRWILYTDTTWQADGPAQSLWVYSTVTGQRYPLFENCEYEQSGASWNYDGTKYCFIRKAGDSNYLYVMDFTTPEQEKRVVRDIDKPLAFELKQNYPNPFNIQTTIEFSIPESGDVTLTLYSVTGQKVRTLVDYRLDAGRHAIVWDGRDDYGMDVASGTYLSLLSMGDSTRRNKMTLLK